MIKTFGSIDNLLAHLDQVPQKKLREKLESHGEQARLSRQLATLRTDVPVRFRLRISPLPAADPKSLREIFKELEFNKLLKDLPEEDGSREEGLPPDHGPGVLSRLLEETQKGRPRFH